MTSRLPLNAVPGTFASNLSEAEWAGLAAIGHPRKYPNGATLMLEGEPGQHAFIVLEGRVKVVRVSPDGRERLLSIRDQGDIIGELAVLDGEPRLGTVIAFGPVDVLVLPGAALRTYLETVPRVAVALLIATSLRFRESTIKRSQYGASDTVGRLAARLVELAERYGEAHERGTIVALPLTQEEIGSWAVGSPAGIAKALQTMREFGWIETERRRMVICDLQALKNRAG